MKAQILPKERYEEYEAFVQAHPAGSFTQSVRWARVKNNWDFEVVALCGDGGEILGGASVLIQKVPFIGTSFLYAPRGPVCDLHDRAALEELKKGIDLLARQRRAHVFKMDPDIPMSDGEFIRQTQQMGFTQIAGDGGFETIQARFNYRLYLQGRGEKELFANLTQKTRYNVRLAVKRGVQIRVAGPEELDEFVRIMQVTGERDGFNVRPKAYFERFLSALGEHARLYMGYYEGQAVCGAIATNYAGKTCYVYGASDNAYRNVMPNYLIQWEMIRWAVETGCTVYDFQGVSGNITDENDHLYGLYRFKRGFNGQLDELAGEFDYVYRPFAYQFVDTAIDAREKLSDWRRRRAAKASAKARKTEPPEGTGDKK